MPGAEIDMHNYQARTSTTLLESSLVVARHALIAGMVLTSACAYDDDDELDQFGDYHEGQCDRAGSWFEWSGESVDGLEISRDFACARRSDGRLYCLDAVDEGGLALTTEDVADRASMRIGGGGPTRETPAIEVAVGHANTCAMLAGGQVRCWGSLRFDDGDGGGDGGEDGGGDGGEARTTGVSAIAVDFGEPGVALEARRDRTCATLASGAVWCWDQHLTMVQDWPGEPSSSSRFHSLHGDFPHIVVIGEDDTLYCGQ